MNKLIFGCLVAITIFSSCNRQVGATFGKKKENLEIIDSQFEYISAKAKFKFENEEKRISATANFRIKKDSIIWISISNFGFEGARILIDSGSVRILDKLKKQHNIYTFEELSREYGFDFNFQMIQSVILGSLIEPYKNQRIEKINNYLTYTTFRDVYTFQNYIGTKSMKLEKVQVFDEDTKNTVTVNYSNFILVDSQLFPNEILAVIDYHSEKKTKTEISISFNKMVIEDNPIRFPYLVPNKYEKR